MKKGTIYVGCALTDVPDDEKGRAFRTDIHRLRAALKEIGYDVLEFFGLQGGQTKEVCESVYKTDTGNIQACSLFLAICTYPSTGLGIELREAAEIKRSTILAAVRGTKVTRMAMGQTCINPNQRPDVVEYDDILELVRVVEDYFQGLGL